VAWKIVAILVWVISKVVILANANVAIVQLPSTAIWVIRTASAPNRFEMRGL